MYRRSIHFRVIRFHTFLFYFIFWQIQNFLKTKELLFCYIITHLYSLSIFQDILHHIFPFHSMEDRDVPYEHFLAAHCRLSVPIIKAWALQEPSVVQIFLLNAFKAVFPHTTEPVIICFCNAVTVTLAYNTHISRTALAFFIYAAHS